jgi:hypothetical protein
MDGVIAAQIVRPDKRIRLIDYRFCYLKPR